jgi:transcriptional regulator with XRE-family HTH domain
MPELSALQGAANERLRGAMIDANMTLQGLADRLGVDVKSVERWITHDRTPHARNAHAAAKILGADPYRLWPRLERRHRARPTPRDELVTCYPTRGVVPADLWRSLLLGAVGRIDLAVSNLLWLADAVWDLHTVLADKAAEGVRVRLVVPAAGSAPATLADLFPSFPTAPNLRVIEHTALRSDVLRADDDLLVTTPVDGLMPVLAPVLHLRRLGPAPLTGSYLTALDHLCSTGTPARSTGLRAVAA